ASFPGGQAALVINADGSDIGLGGSIVMRAKTVNSSGNIHASAQSGGFVKLCGDTQVSAGGPITTLADPGINHFFPNAAMTTSGAMTAGSQNQIKYSDASKAPVITGTITPAAVPPGGMLDPSIGPCVAPTTTTTTSSTTIPVPTTTSTTIPGGTTTTSST